MKTKRYSTEQIIGILKEAEAGLPVKGTHSTASRSFSREKAHGRGLFSGLKISQ